MYTELLGLLSRKARQQMRLSGALNRTTVPLRVLREYLRFSNETTVVAVILAAAEMKEIPRLIALRELRRAYIRRGILPRYASDACNEFLRDEQRRALLNGRYVEEKNKGGMR